MDSLKFFQEEPDGEICRNGHPNTGNKHHHHVGEREPKSCGHPDYLVIQWTLEDERWQEVNRSYGWEQ